MPFKVSVITLHFMHVPLSLSFDLSLTRSILRKAFSHHLFNLIFSVNYFMMLEQCLTRTSRKEDVIKHSISEITLKILDIMTQKRGWSLGNDVLRYLSSIYEEIIIVTLKTFNMIISRTSFKSIFSHF